jgi:hypothetical protein
MIRHQVKRLTGVSSKDRHTSIIHFDGGSDLVEIELGTTELRRLLREVANQLSSPEPLNLSTGSHSGWPRQETTSQASTGIARKGQGKCRCTVKSIPSQ